MHCRMYCQAPMRRSGPCACASGEQGASHRCPFAVAPGLARGRSPPRPSMGCGSASRCAAPPGAEREQPPCPSRIREACSQCYPQVVWQRGDRRGSVLGDSEQQRRRLDSSDSIGEAIALAQGQTRQSAACDDADVAQPWAQRYDERELLHALQSLMQVPSAPSLLSALGGRAACTCCRAADLPLSNRITPHWSAALGRAQRVALCPLTGGASEVEASDTELPPLLPGSLTTPDVAPEALQLLEAAARDALGNGVHRPEASRCRGPSRFSGESRPTAAVAPASPLNGPLTQDWHPAGLTRHCVSHLVVPILLPSDSLPLASPPFESGGHDPLCDRTSTGSGAQSPALQAMANHAAHEFSNFDNGLDARSSAPAQPLRAPAPNAHASQASHASERSQAPPPQLAVAAHDRCTSHAPYTAPIDLAGASGTIIESSTQAESDAAVLPPVLEPSRTRAAAEAARPHAELPGSKLRVLIVEDERINRRMLRRMLSNCGVSDVVDADDGTSVRPACAHSVALRHSLDRAPLGGRASSPGSRRWRHRDPSTWC